MAQGRYVQLSEAQRTEVWRRWKAGESLHRIGRAFDRPHTSIHCLLAHHGGIVNLGSRTGDGQTQRLHGSDECKSLLL